MGFDLFYWTPYTSCDVWTKFRLEAVITDRVKLFPTPLTTSTTHPTIVQISQHATSQYPSQSMSSTLPPPPSMSQSTTSTAPSPSPAPAPAHVFNTRTISSTCASCFASRLHSYNSTADESSLLYSHNSSPTLLHSILQLRHLGNFAKSTPTVMEVRYFPKMNGPTAIENVTYGMFA